ncbi:MAG: glycine dehydrogenase subunit 2, partial [Gammaproteobacteria bacterium]
MEFRRDYHTRLRRFHEAKWDEEIIYELSVPGQIGVLVPKASVKIESAIGDAVSVLPENLRRKSAPDLPEVHQMRVNRHFMRLTQEILGADIT